VICVTVSSPHNPNFTEVLQITAPSNDEVYHVPMLGARMKPGRLVFQLLTKESVSDSEIHLCAELEQKQTITVHVTNSESTEWLPCIMIVTYPSIEVTKENDSFFFWDGAEKG